MSGTIQLECGALAYSVTGRPRADGKALYQIFGADRKVWRAPPAPTNHAAMRVNSNGER